MSASLTKIRPEKLMNNIKSSSCAVYFILLRHFYMLYSCFVILNFPCREADGSRFLLKFQSDYSQKSSWPQLMVQFVARVYRVFQLKVTHFEVQNYQLKLTSIFLLAAVEASQCYFYMDKTQMSKPSECATT